MEESDILLCLSGAGCHILFLVPAELKKKKKKKKGSAAKRDRRISEDRAQSRGARYCYTAPGGDGEI